MKINICLLLILLPFPMYNVYGEVLFSGNVDVLWLDLAAQERDRDFDGYSDTISYEILIQTGITDVDKVIWFTIQLMINYFNETSSNYLKYYQSWNDGSIHENNPNWDLAGSVETEFNGSHTLQIQFTTGSTDEYWSKTFYTYSYNDTLRQYNLEFNNAQDPNNEPQFPPRPISKETTQIKTELGIPLRGEQLGIWGFISSLVILLSVIVYLKIGRSNRPSN